MTNREKHPRTWRTTDTRWKVLKVYCANNGTSVQELMDEAMSDLAKKKGFRLP
jgi:hypothetical protein